jgi:hypothetical protein
MSALDLLSTVDIPVAPPCFASRHAWRQYLLGAAAAQVPGKNARGPILLVPGQPARFDHRVNFCHDCEPAHRLAMQRKQSCHPRWLRDMETADAR